MSHGSSVIEFDEKYMAAWRTLKSWPGLFRNTAYEATVRRRLPGPLGLVVQFNPEHIKTKRPSSMATRVSPQDIPVSRAWDPALFNFMKAKPAEIIVRVRTDTDAGTAQLTFASTTEFLAGGNHAGALPAPGDPDDHPLFANVNPLLDGHGLFVPRMLQGQPQVLTTEAIHAGLLVQAMPGRPDFRMGYNSLGAWASVNHLHLHCFYLSGSGGLGIADTSRANGSHHAHTSNGTVAADGVAGHAIASSVGDASCDVFPTLQMPCERAARTKLADYDLGRPGTAANGSSTSLWLAEMVGWPTSGFVFSLHGAEAATDPAATAALANATGELIARLTASNTPHNLLISDHGRTVMVMPRAVQVIRNRLYPSSLNLTWCLSGLQRGGGAEDGVLAIALAEICGLGILYTQV
jgi:hypothetical protein